MVKSFLNWLSENRTLGTEEVDARQIESAYDKAKFSVKLVRLYDEMTKKSLLKNISTIATLQSGAFGLYNSAENRSVIGPNLANRLKMIFGQNVMQNKSLERIPKVVIQKYVPDVNPNELQPSDVIRVNVQKHLTTHGDSLTAILEIASTIVHEATHELELQTTGKTSEVGPTKAEKDFMFWVKQNWNNIITRIPELKAYGTPT